MSQEKFEKTLYDKEVEKLEKEFPNILKKKTKSTPRSRAIEPEEIDKEIAEQLEVDQRFKAPTDSTLLKEKEEEAKIILEKDKHETKKTE